MVFCQSPGTLQDVNGFQFTTRLGPIEQCYKNLLAQRLGVPLSKNCFVWCCRPTWRLERNRTDGGLAQGVLRSTPRFATLPACSLLTQHCANASSRFSLLSLLPQSIFPNREFVVKAVLERATQEKGCGGPSLGGFERTLMALHVTGQLCPEGLRQDWLGVLFLERANVLKNLSGFQERTIFSTSCFDNFKMKVWGCLFKIRKLF